MPGWIAQWYGNVPAVWNANENCPPGATVPEFHPVASDVDVWDIESVFVHVTVVPAATVRVAGLNCRLAVVQIFVEVGVQPPPPPPYGDERYLLQSRIVPLFIGLSLARPELLNHGLGW